MPENPYELDGETVTVDGTVTEVVSTQALVLNEALLVARADAGVDVEIGQTTRVTGTVSEAFEVAQAEEELGMTFDEKEFFTDWLGQPALLAGDVQP